MKKTTEKNCNLILNLGRSYLFNGKEQKKMKMKILMVKINNPNFNKFKSDKENSTQA